MTVLFALFSGALTGCSSIAFYAQSIGGHLQILQAAKPISEWLDDPAVAPPLKARLRQAAAIRDFASHELGLPDNASYRSYVDLGRSFAVWNVVAAPEFSLRLRQWCFLIAGCVVYRGYHDLAAAERYAANLRREGLDVQVFGVRAYSTLGWTPDPLLSTFLELPEVETARLIFHELSHQLLYVPGDSTFNESFATAFEDEAVRRWLARHHSPAQIAAWSIQQARREAFLSLLSQARAALAERYHSGLDTVAMRRAKADILAELRQRYHRAQADPASPLFQFGGYDRFFAGELNNASLAVVSTYTQMRPAFAKLLQEARGDLREFIGAARALGALPKTERERRLQQLLESVPQ